MSLLWVTAASKHLVYEVGEWDDEPGPHMHVTNYPVSDRVPPEHFGLPTYTDRMRVHSPEGYPHEDDVPTHLLRAEQDYVYAPHVRNLASVPQGEFHKTQAWDPVEVYKSKSGLYVIEAGHHRSAAALLRGDSTLRATVKGVER